MDHISQYDWMSPRANTFEFITENDLDSCVIEKILHNTFVDPLLSSESENESENHIDWDKIFEQNRNKKQQLIFVPGFRKIPPYPKVSSLTRDQHYACLKVLCDQHPEILELHKMQLPTRRDLKIFQSVKEQYEKEMEEYKEWAKSLWVNEHKMRALRPHPIIEMVYGAEFKQKALEMSSFPKTFEMAAQIPLTEANDKYEIEFDKELIGVDIKHLPQIACPEMKTKQYSVIKNCLLPEPCPKHPCKFILPGEKSTSTLPVLEVHRELAQYAADHDSQIIVSETALRCLVEHDRCWNLPVTVSQVIGCDGEKSNVMVLGSEFSDTKQFLRTRTYRALRHLLNFSLTDSTKYYYSKSKEHKSQEKKITSRKQPREFKKDVVILDSSSDDEGNLLIDEEEINELVQTETEIESCHQQEMMNGCINDDTNEHTEELKIVTDEMNEDFVSSCCTCEGTDFERPPPRSYRRWTLRNTMTNDEFAFIVHSAHKARDKEDEVILEPIPEYQIDLGGCKQSEEKIKGLLLSLILRRNACLLNVRIDAVTGETVTFEKCHYERFLCQHGAALPAAAAALHCTLGRLRGLLPGCYVLKHEPKHGSNAMLYVARENPRSEALTLTWDEQRGARDEADELVNAPTLTDVLLPIHKFRKILPCAFTTNAHLVAKETKKELSKSKVPPAAIKEGVGGAARRKWPKKKSKKKK